MGMVLLVGVETDRDYDSVKMLFMKEELSILNFSVKPLD